MKKILLIVFLFASAHVVQAQDNKQEMLKSLQVAFITRQLELSPADSELNYQICRIRPMAARRAHWMRICILTLAFN